MKNRTPMSAATKSMLLWLSILFSAGVVSAQGEPPKIELGVQTSILRLNALSEVPLGIGGRFTYNVAPYLAIEAEATYFPQDPSGNFGETLALAGARVGWQFHGRRVYARVRPGVIHFGGALPLTRTTEPAVDIGIGYDHYWSRHVGFRFDIGDTIIPFGGARVLTGPAPVRLGTTHNLETSIGLGIRF
jgi:hypothetical protein